jgi:hypothetical protein
MFIEIRNMSLKDTSPLSIIEYSPIYQSETNSISQKIIIGNISASVFTKVPINIIFVYMLKHLCPILTRLQKVRAFGRI